MKLFGVEKKDKGLLATRIFTFFGVKLKIIRKRKTLRNLLRKVDNCLEKDSNLFNGNLVNMLTIYSLAENDLLYFKTDKSLIIFPKKVLFVDSDFIRDFFSNHVGSKSLFRFGILDKTSSLYREHEGLLRSGTIIYKYVNKKEQGTVARSIVSVNKKGEFFLEQGWLGLENCHYSGIVLANLPKRKIVSGVVVRDYIKDLEEKEKIEILTRLFDWLFTHTLKNNSAKIDGSFWDCHSLNFIISENKFHFFDKEIVVKNGIDKWRCIYYFFGAYPLENGEKLREYFLHHYNFEKYTEKNFIDYESNLFRDDVKLMKKASILNKKLFEKYFGEL